MRAVRRLAPTLVLVLAALALPLAAEAQGEGLSGVTVSVRGATDGRALVGAQLVVDGLGVGALTDATGVARLRELPPGSKTLRVRYLGYAEQAVLLLLEPGRTVPLAVELREEPIQLAAVQVVARRRSVLERNGFFERKSGGFGVFIARDQIEKMQPRFMSDVLRRVAGVSLTTTASGGMSRASLRGTKVLGSCPIQYYLDGTMTTGFNIDEVTPTDVEGVEVYRGAATIPPAFNKGTAMCGVILIWTRVQ